ncbi:hypothetical protein EBU95_21870, partial [bacterium]|nr:hypothetical protein [bacterium]
MSEIVNEILGGKGGGGGAGLTPAEKAILATVPNKQNKVIPSTVGNIQGLDALGDSTDTGKKFNDAGTTTSDVWSAEKTITAIATAKANDKGYFVDLTALQTVFPVGQDGWFAILGTTDTVWIWDSDTNAWVDSDQKGQVSSVFGRIGIITAQSGDYDANQIDYDNTTSGAISTNVQDGIDEAFSSINGKVD